jgi:hypothetical protein
MLSRNFEGLVTLLDLSRTSENTICHAPFTLLSVGSHHTGTGEAADNRLIIVLQAGAGGGGREGEGDGEGGGVREHSPMTCVNEE